MYKPVRILLYCLSVLYPAAVFCCLVVFRIPMRVFSLSLAAFGIVYLLLSYARRRSDSVFSGKRLLLPFLSAGVFCIIAAAVWISGSAFFVKLYPVFVNGFMLFVFGSSLLAGEPVVYAFAVIQDTSIPGSLAASRVKKYCAVVTVIWCVFFLLNGTASVFLALLAGDAVWFVYTGGIAHVLMGILFAGEFAVRKNVQKKMPHAVPISRISAVSRNDGAVVCYDRKFSDGIYKTWKDFLIDTAKIRLAVQKTGCESCILHCADEWYFLTAYAALLQCGCRIRLTANISPSFISEIRDGNTVFLTDQSGENRLDIASVLNGDAPPETVWRSVPRVDADSTVIDMYTSGTTGRPKVVRQRLTEFEADNAFVLSRWGEELLSRVLCTTVSHHHIYGLLFSCMLPFTAGVPFRRRRIEHPEELETLDDVPYMIISVPAFLKRAAELVSRYSLKNPWIFTSGGLLLPETASRTADVFGFWPYEIYGSTETSGIAWRCSKYGTEWTPFANAEITLSDDGCICVRSPYVRDPAGFVTGDLGEILPDGRFILKGRADSIVKIEEKRISLPEVESRLIQSGFVKEAVVIPLENRRRQYLGAVLVLNDAGKERFAAAGKPETKAWFRIFLTQFFEQVLIPKKWRILERLPAQAVDEQGKKKREVFKSLFDGSAETQDKRTKLPAAENISCSEGRAAFEITVPPDYAYFDGHFPSFKLLPAVAQIHMVVRYAACYFGTPVVFTRMKRVKFSNMIRPGMRVRIELKLDKIRKLSFVISDCSGSAVFSKGSIQYGQDGGTSENAYGN